MYPQHDAQDGLAAIDLPETVGGKPRQVGRMRAAFVTLVRNNELWEIVKSIRQIEDRFNRKYHYPWIFLNDVPFTQEFMDITSGLISGQVKFGTSPHLFSQTVHSWFAG